MKSLSLASLSESDRRYQERNLAEALTFEDFLIRRFPERSALLDPIFRERDIGMLHGPRGLGKTNFILGAGYAIASGGRFLRWSAPKPQPVLLVDGEMSPGELQRRLAGIARGDGRKLDSKDIQLRILCEQVGEDPAHSLATLEGRDWVERNLGDSRLLILDNISSLFGSLTENDAEQWEGPQRWLLDLRRRGVSVLLVHHSSKSGDQRGTSRREDVLDWVIRLRAPHDKQPEQGCHFEVSFTKARSVFGSAVEPFDARLEPGPGGELLWRVQELRAKHEDQAREMFGIGMSPSDVMSELGISKATAYRLRKKLVKNS